MSVPDSNLVVLEAPESASLSGAFARKVAQDLGRDLLLVRDDRRRGSFRKIMIPVDHRGRVEDAVRRAIELAAPGAEVEIVHAWLLPHPLGDSLEGEFAAPLLAAAHNAALRRCERLVADHRDAHVHLSARAIQGPPRTELVRHAVEGNFDLIVIPSHRRRHLTGRLLDSVADALVHGAMCSVLICGGQ